MSFAQFERELISERTRDKMSATRRKGKYAGGRPVLGYDVDHDGKRLVVNPDEASRVRAIFALYLELGSLLPVVQELEKRGWRNKSWVTRAGKPQGGEALTRTNLHRLLNNPVYVGKVRHKTETFPGEHPALIDEPTWQRVQAQLAANDRGGAGCSSRDRFGALLRGLLHCGCCGAAMTPTHTKRGSKRYRYYACTQSQKRGTRACPNRSVPAGELERVVVERLRGIGSDPEVLAQTVAQARLQDQQQLADLEAERRALGRDLARWNEELRLSAQQLGSADDPAAVLNRLTELQQRTAQAERRLLAVGEQMQGIRKGLLHEGDAAAALSRFGPVWEALRPHEQVRLVRLVVERATYDSTRGTLNITLHPTGIRTLAEELNQITQEKQA